MPQTPTEWWKQHLGSDWAAVHSRWLDTIGNLTLTGYNPELSNSDFPRKKTLLVTSHLELSRAFASNDRWDEESIRRRGEQLTELALKVWPSFVNFDADWPTDDEPEDAGYDGKSFMGYVLDQIGVVERQVGTGRFRIMRMADGKIVAVKYSRNHPKHFWFGIHASFWVDYQRAGATHLALVLGTYGYAVIPTDLIRQYISEARVSCKTSGEVRHYHICVSTGVIPELFHYANTSRISVEAFFTVFTSAELSKIANGPDDVLGDLVAS